MTGRPHLAAGSLLVLAAALIQPAPAEAQVSSFFDGLFGRKEAPEAAPASPAMTAPVAPKKPSTQAVKPAKDAKAEREKSGGLKPTAKNPLADAKNPPADAKVAAVAPPAAALAEADPAALLAQANAYFNSMTTLTGNFVQIAADGRRIGGKLYLAKPGRLRFDYDQPSPLEVVADGTSVAVKDRKLATQDLYFISQTPLKFLLREKIDLARDLSVTEVANDPAGVRLLLEDRATLGGTSKIQLFFDAEMKTLSQWRITDPQGYQTTVQLSNLQKGKAVDGTMFFINYGRSEDKAMEKQIKAQ